MKQTTKKVLAGIGAVAIAAGLGFGLGATTVQPQHIYVEKPVLKVVEKEVPVIKYVNVTKEVPVIVEKNVTVQVPFENTTFEEKLCDRLMFEDIQQCKEEVEAEDKAIDLAFKELKRNVLDFLDKENLISNDNDAEIIKVYDKFEDIEIVESNFDDNEYEFKMKVKVDDDGDKKKFLVTVHVEDGEAELIEAEEL